MQNAVLKRIVAYVLTLAMCVTLLPMNVHAVEASTGIQEQVGPDASNDGSGMDVEDSANESLDDNTENKDQENNNEEIGDQDIEDSDQDKLDADKDEEEQDVPIGLNSVTPQAPDTDITEGEYYISSSMNIRQVLDVDNGSKSNGANIQLFSSNVSDAQKWKVSFDENGYATLTNVGSGKVLDVSQGSARNAQNVQQYSMNNTRAQKWVIKKSSYGYVISSALSKAYDQVDENQTSTDIVKPADYVLDCKGGYSINRTNIQIYAENNTKAQSFRFTKVSRDVASGEQVIEDGIYNIGSLLANGKVLDVSNGSNANGANVQIYSNNSTLAQRFQFTYDESSQCYSITNIASGLALDAADANPLNNTNVRMWTKNSGNAQKWAITTNEDGSFTILNRATALSLDISGGSTANGANVQLYSANGTGSQQFALNEVEEAIPDGVYSIFTYLKLNQTFDIPNASLNAGTQVQLYSGNGIPSQKYVLHRVEKNVYTIAAVASGQFLTAESGKVVQRWGNGADDQKWNLIFDDTGFILKNVATETVMDCTGGSSANGTKIQMHSANGTTSQRFRIAGTPVVSNGIYEISTALNTKRRVDIANGSRSNGANVQIWDSNGTNSQKFQFTSISDNIYRITEVGSGRALDVKNGSTSNGANVQIWDSNGTNSQKWKVTITNDGWYTFTNIASGKVLDICAAGNFNGANIQSYAGNLSVAQRWHLIPTTKKIEDTVLERAQNMANGKVSATNNLIMVDLSAHRVMIFQGGVWHWSNIQNWWCTNGAPGSPTVTGEFTVGGRGYSFGSGYTCYYYTQFYGNYLFHSVLYYQGTFNIKDGRLGMALSHGCVRLDINCAKWIYDNIPSGTKVVTYY